MNKVKQRALTVDKHLAVFIEVDVDKHIKLDKERLSRDRSGRPKRETLSPARETP